MKQNKILLLLMIIIMTLNFTGCNELIMASMNVNKIEDLSNRLDFSDKGVIDFLTTHYENLYKGRYREVYNNFNIESLRALDMSLSEFESKNSIDMIEVNYKSVFINKEGTYNDFVDLYKVSIRTEKNGVEEQKDISVAVSKENKLEILYENAIEKHSYDFSSLDNDKIDIKLSQYIIYTDGIEVKVDFKNPTNNEYLLGYAGTESYLVLETDIGSHQVKLYPELLKNRDVKTSYFKFEGAKGNINTVTLTNIIPFVEQMPQIESKFDSKIY